MHGYATERDRLRGGIAVVEVCSGFGKSRLIARSWHDHEDGSDKYRNGCLLSIVPSRRSVAFLLSHTDTKAGIRQN